MIWRRIRNGRKLELFHHLARNNVLTASIVDDERTSIVDDERTSSTIDTTSKGEDLVVLGAVFRLR